MAMSRNDLMLLVAVVACVAALLVVPEIRDLLGLPNHIPPAASIADSDRGKPPTNTGRPNRPAPTSPERSSRDTNRDQRALTVTEQAAQLDALSDQRALTATEQAAQLDALSDQRGLTLTELAQERRSVARERAEQIWRGEKTSVNFRVVPKDVAVYVDGTFAGRADGEILGAEFEGIVQTGGELTISLAPGRHVVALVRPGYEAQEQEIVLDQGPREVRATLKPQR